MPVRRVASIVVLASAALEDGSYVLDARRDPGCRVGVTIAPTGGITTVTVLYGAACPKP